MKFAALIFFTDETIGVTTLAQELEQRGFESMWLPEHTHIPTSRESPYSQGDLPRQYVRVLDPFVSLTAAAAVTTTLGIGTAVCLLAQHDPIVLAKTVATLDLISNGRMQFGMGLGWNVEEMRNHGVDPKMRRSIAREKILAMQGLWSQDEFGYQGKYVNFEPSWSWPNPVQPHMPVHMGGAGGPLGFKHLAEYADGWLPDMSMLRPEKVRAKLGEIADACEAIGRDPKTVQISVTAAAAEPDKLQLYADLGADRCIFVLPSAGKDEVFTELDRVQQAIEGAGYTLG
jgi:probable F420-dependent oxidoreductase